MDIVFKEIEKRHNEFYDNEIKSDLYYAVAYNKDGDCLGEVNGCYSFCEDCKDDVIQDLNDQLKENRKELDCNFHDSQIDEVDNIQLICEGSPERDDFENCEYCGELIYVGLLHTFTQEIDHYLSENLNLTELSNDDCYRLHELIENHSDKQLIQELREKIISDNN